MSGINLYQVAQNLNWYYKAAAESWEQKARHQQFTITTYLNDLRIMTRRWRNACNLANTYSEQIDELQANQRKLLDDNTNLLNLLCTIRREFPDVQNEYGEEIDNNLLDMGEDSEMSEDMMEGLFGDVARTLDMDQFA